MSKPIFNLVVELASSTRHYQLGAKSVSIGRADRNAIILDEDAVSSRHCELRQSGSGNGYEILDLDSTNGTRLNGESLGKEPRELHDGDRILLGLTVKAKFVRVVEIKEKVEIAPPVSGSQTRRLEKPKVAARPSINPVAAAVARAAREKAKVS